MHRSRNGVGDADSLVRETKHHHIERSKVLLGQKREIHSPLLLKVGVPSSLSLLYSSLSIVSSLQRLPHIRGPAFLPGLASANFG